MTDFSNFTPQEENFKHIMKHAKGRYGLGSEKRMSSRQPQNTASVTMMSHDDGLVGLYISKSGLVRAGIISDNSDQEIYVSMMRGKGVAKDIIRVSTVNEQYNRHSAQTCKHEETGEEYYSVVSGNLPGGMTYGARNGIRYSDKEFSEELSCFINEKDKAINILLPNVILEQESESL